MFVVVDVEDGFPVGESSRRLNLEGLCDPASFLDRFTRTSTYPYDDLSTCILEYYSGRIFRPSQKTRR